MLDIFINYKKHILIVKGVDKEHNMISRKNILKLEARRKIYQFILKNPGSYLREFSRKMNIPKTTVEHHLRYLKKHGFLEVKSEDGYTRYYAAKKVSEIDKKLFDLFRQDTPRTIILLLLISFGLSQAQMIKIAKQWKNHPSKIGIYLNKHPSTISYYFNKLVAMDIIEGIPNGNETKYIIKNPEIFLDLIITYENSLMKDDSVYPFIKYLVSPDKEKIYLAIDHVIETVYEVCPHPYHV